jgi:2,3-bisphosphoglycerate-independent phosphoglycerate mutase
MRILFIFLDGIGLGDDDLDKNPLARAEMPFLGSLLAGRKITTSGSPYSGDRAALLALDANMGVTGLPQSATGQAVLLTGINIPKELGYHYGPKPNPQVAAYLKKGDTLYSRLRSEDKHAVLLNAYPPRYFEGIVSGKRLYSSIPLAYTSAGYPLFTQEDYFAGRALSADFTGQGWRSMLEIPDAPIYTPQAAGQKLGQLAQENNFALFEYWASDYAGHKQDMQWAIDQMEAFDGVLEGLVGAWNTSEDLILMTSDHGNMEDLSTRRHTAALVPCLVIGRQYARFTDGLVDLTDITPRIIELLIEHS